MVKFGLDHSYNQVQENDIQAGSIQVSRCLGLWLITLDWHEAGYREGSTVDD